MNANTIAQTDSMEILKKHCDIIAETINKDINGYKIAWELHTIESENDRNIIYFIENTQTHKVKIGKTTNIAERLKQLRRCALQIGEDALMLQCQYLICCSTKKECSKMEKMLHDKFKDRNSIGEWFDISPEEIKVFLDEYFCGGLLINNIPIYCGFPDVEDLELPLIIGYDFGKYIEYINFISNHSIKKYRIAIRREYGIDVVEALHIYNKYKNTRLDKFIIDFYEPYISKIK